MDRMGFRLQNYKKYPMRGEAGIKNRPAAVAVTVRDEVIVVSGSYGLNLNHRL